MISYTTTFTDTTSPLDLFQGASPTGKWNVHIRLSTSGAVFLSTDGTTQGMQIAGATTYSQPVLEFQVKDQPLYLITTTAAAKTVSVLITPVVETKITTC